MLKNLIFRAALAKLNHLILSFFLLVGCAHMQHTLSTEIINDELLTFSGKGAGAGMMLMSTMGPMGIAIGVAIDEGIAKDIRTTADQGGVDIRDLLLDAIESHEFALIPNTFVSMRVERFGFISWPGPEDKVMPQLHLLAIHRSGDLMRVRFPEDMEKIQQEAILPDLATLDAVKKDSNEISRLFNRAIRYSFQYLSQQ